MPQAGSIYLGRAVAGDTSLHPNSGLLENDTGEDSLYLENRFAGPLTVQWASRQTGGQGFGPTWSVPPLSRVVMPWHPEYDCLWRMRGRVEASNNTPGGIDIVTYFHTVIINSGVRNYARSQLKWLFTSGLDPGQWELYPRHTWQWVTARVNSMAQGVNLITHYVPTGPTVPAIGGQVMRPLFATPDSSLSPPQGLSQGDWRIMAFRVHAMGGTANPTDLEASAFWDLEAGAEGQGSSIMLFGSINYPAAGATLSSVDSPMGSALFDIPGAVAVTYDLDNISTGLNATFCVDYYCACPLD